MTFSILFQDEFSGFYRSKAMLALLVGLPMLIIFVYWMRPDTSGIPLAAFTAMIASSLAGTIAAVMVAIGMINEKNKKVYDLFLVRPVRGYQLIMAKFTAVFLFVTLAVMVSIGVGMAADMHNGNPLTGEGLVVLAKAIVMSVSMIAVASAVGVVIGAAISSILVGAIVVLYGGNQLVGLVAMLSLELSDNLVVQVLPSLAICITLLAVAVLFFNRRRN